MNAKAKLVYAALGAIIMAVGCLSTNFVTSSPPVGISVSEGVECRFLNIVNDEGKPVIRLGSNANGGFIKVLDNSQNLTVQLPKTVKKAREERTVYITRTGAKYHRGSCRYLRQSKIPMKLSLARLNYGPCSVCRP